MNVSHPLTHHIALFFREELRIARGVSKHTYRSYSISIRYLTSYLELQLRKKLFNIMTDELTYELIYQWMIHEKTTHDWSVSTWNARLAAIKTFVKFLSKTNVRYLDLSARVELIRAQKRQQKQADYLSIEEFERVLKSITPFKFVDLRDKVIFQVLFFSGARVAELTNLRFQDVILTNPKTITLFLFGKNRKERNVPVMEKATVKNLKRYMELSKQTGIASEYLFVGRDGKRMTEENIRRIVKKHFGSVIENKNITPHSFRHSAAMNWLEKGMGIFKVSILLGHEDIKTTTKYLQSTFKIKSDALKAAGQDEKISHVFKTDFKSNNEFWEHLGINPA